MSCPAKRDHPIDRHTCISSVGAWRLSEVRKKAVSKHAVKGARIGSQACTTGPCPYRRSRGTSCGRCEQQHANSQYAERVLHHACVQGPGSCMPAGKSSRLQPSGTAQDAS